MTIFGHRVHYRTTFLCIHYITLLPIYVNLYTLLLCTVLYFYALFLSGSTDGVLRNFNGTPVSCARNKLVKRSGEEYKVK